MVFYRKYRPQNLEELIGQTSVKQALKAAISAEKLAHAYLFCGPKGTGKTSTARILAKIVNCESAVILGSGATPESNKKDSGQAGMTGNLPCNKCASCISITDGSNLDVIEMDAASNRGIEDIRALRETIKLAPTSARKKVYIIDEVHMLSNDAFNALLKTLEEPPPHVLFILATTEVQKIPQTILSRVQKLDFKLASTEEILEDLTNIIKTEKIKIDQEALLTLAKKANGSFRDAEKFLDQMSSFGEITKITVDEHFSVGTFEGVLEILENIVQKNPQKALEKLVSQLEVGINPKELNLSLLDVLRQILFIKNGLGESVVKLDVGEENYKLTKDLADKFSLEELIYSLNCLQNALEQSRFVSIPSLPLEIAVVESCGIEAQSEEKVESAEKKLDVRGEPPKASLAEGGKVDKEVRTLKLDNLTSNLQSHNPSSNLQHLTSNDDIAKIQEKWTYILETVRQYNYSLEALLRTVKISECTENVLIIEVPYSFHQRILEAPKSRDLLESILADILGRAVKVATKLGQRPVRKEELANIEVAADDEIVRIATEIFNSEQIN